MEGMLMKLALVIMALFVSGSAIAQTAGKQYQVGLYLGNQMLADGTYTNNIHCGSGEDYTCTGSAGFNSFVGYYVRTDEGVWLLLTDRQSNDITVRQMGMTPMHGKAEKPNLLDSLKAGDKVAFRIEKDHRLGAKGSFHVFIPRADDPKKEEKFEGTLTHKTAPAAEAPKPTDNIKAMCDAHRFSPDDEKKYCTESAPVASVSVAQPVSPDVAALRMKYVDNIASMLKQQGKPGYVEFSGDTETMHAPEGTKEKFEALLGNKGVLAAFDYMQVNKLVYTNDKDLTLVWQRRSSDQQP
jgi:hypothetical protein